jgi:hypothetical protein
VPLPSIEACDIHNKVSAINVPRPPLVMWIRSTRIPGLRRESVDVMIAVQTQTYFLLPRCGVEDELGQLVPP